MTLSKYDSVIQVQKKVFVYLTSDQPPPDNLEDYTQIAIRSTCDGESCEHLPNDVLSKLFPENDEIYVYVKGKSEGAPTTLTEEVKESIKRHTDEITLMENRDDDIKDNNYCITLMRASLNNKTPKCPDLNKIFELFELSNIIPYISYKKKHKIFESDLESSFESTFWKKIMKDTTHKEKSARESHELKFNFRFNDGITADLTIGSNGSVNVMVSASKGDAMKKDTGLRKIQDIISKILELENKINFKFNIHDDSNKVEFSNIAVHIKIGIDLRQHHPRDKLLESISYNQCYFRINTLLESSKKGNPDRMTTSQLSFIKTREFSSTNSQNRFIDDHVTQGYSYKYPTTKKYDNAYLCKLFMELNPDELTNRLESSGGRSDRSVVGNKIKFNDGNNDGYLTLIYYTKDLDDINYFMNILKHSLDDVVEETRLANSNAGPLMMLYPNKEDKFNNFSSESDSDSGDSGSESDSSLELKSESESESEPIGVPNGVVDIDVRFNEFKSDTEFKFKRMLSLLPETQNIKYSRKCQKPIQPIAFTKSEFEIIMLNMEKFDRKYPVTPNSELRIKHFPKYKNIYLLSCDVYCKECNIAIEWKEYIENFEQKCPLCNDSRSTEVNVKIQDKKIIQYNQIVIRKGKVGDTDVAKEEVLFPCRLQKSVNQEKRYDEIVFTEKDAANVPRGEYIHKLKSSYTPKDKFGDIPEFLHRFFKNPSFLTYGSISSEKMLGGGFLRYGIYEEGFDMSESFLECVRYLYNAPPSRSTPNREKEKLRQRVTIIELKNLIKKNIGNPVVLSKARTLVDMFCNGSVNGSNTTIESFIKWKKLHSGFISSLTFPKGILADYLNRLYNATINILAFIDDVKSLHDHSILWEIVCQPSVLFDDGINLFMFSIENNKVEYICPYGKQKLRFLDAEYRAECAFLTIKKNGMNIYEPLVQIITEKSR